MFSKAKIAWAAGNLNKLIDGGDESLIPLRNKLDEGYWKPWTLTKAEMTEAENAIYAAQDQGLLFKS